MSDEDTKRRISFSAKEEEGFTTINLGQQEISEDCIEYRVVGGRMSNE